jgi:hypothetical protein
MPGPVVARLKPGPTSIIRLKPDATYNYAQR